MSQEKLALPDIFAEKKKLEQQIAQLQEEKRVALIRKIIDLLIELGSVKPEDWEAQVERFKSFDEPNLTILKDEFQRMVDVVAKKRNLSRRLYR